MSELKDRSKLLFGRENDLQYLVQRVAKRGITAVIGRPQMEKTWLVTELARRIATDAESPYLVGLAESTGQAPDLLLRGVVDLYIRWLDGADYRRQAQAFWQQNKGKLLIGVGQTIGKVFENIEVPFDKPLKVIVSEAFQGLITANETLTSGGVKLPLLQYEQAHELVKLVADISGRPACVILDQWEQSSAPLKDQLKLIQTFVRHIEDWPQFHVIVTIRLEDPADAIYKDLQGLVRQFLE